LPTVTHHTLKFFDVIYGLRPNVNNDPTLIYQPCSESVKFDIKFVGKRVENRVAASCKKAY